MHSKLGSSAESVQSDSAQVELPEALSQLTALPNWVCWRYVIKKAGKKPTKVPYHPNGDNAETDDPKTWSSYEAVSAAVSKFDGIGFVLTGTEIAALDLDDCRNAETGDIEPWAKTLIERAATYAEVSPSGSGFRIIGTGTGDKVHRKLKVPDANGMTCELYRKATRYITVTGNIHCDAHLSNIDGVIDEVLAELDNKREKKSSNRGDGTGSKDLPPALATMLCVSGSGGYPTRSELLFAFLIAALKARVSRETIADAVLDSKHQGAGIFEHVEKNGGRDYLQRQIFRAREAIGNQLSWRELRKDGTPVPSFENARLAIMALDIECKQDLFHDKMLIGFRNDEVKHELQQFIGEMTDNALIALRQLISKTFGFDPDSKHVYDAIKSLALDHCFDPVLDMLSEAEAKWDGKPRLNKWVITYLGCADTDLNKAIGRKSLIAAARRARQPGCKFDYIIVLEGAEGINKSTVIRILAGDNNFSDQSLLGAKEREVMEQLTGVWMHENADLAGMKKAEIESVKSFASRQVDRARPAYGRVVERRPRRGIEWGTTNSTEYLQSPTGNRRWWPLKIGEIKIDDLKRDRLQLLGEAAHYESKGESLLLSGLWDKATEAQEARRAIDPWEEILREMPDRVDFIGKIIHETADGKLNVASVDILKDILAVQICDQTTHHTMRLSNVMKNLGWQRTDHGKVTINSVSVRGYWREKPPEPVASQKPSEGNK